MSLSLNCGADSGYLTIDSTSGIVTMATTFDLETEGVDNYVISCNVIATDTAGQSSTSTLNVDISDGNDIAPVFENPGYNFFIVEGKIVISIVRANPNPTSNCTTKCIVCLFSLEKCTYSTITFHSMFVWLVVSRCTSFSLVATKITGIIVHYNISYICAYWLVIIHIVNFSWTGHTGFGQVGVVSATDGDRTSPNNKVTYSVTPTTQFSIGGTGIITNTVWRYFI